MTVEIQAEQYKKLFALANEWLFLKNVDKSLIDHVSIRENHRFVVYGLSEIGKRIIEELQKSGKEIAYVIDRNAPVYFADFDILTLEDKLPEADLIIVSVIREYEAIKSALMSKGFKNVISIEKIIDDLWIDCWEHDE